MTFAKFIKYFYCFLKNERYIERYAFMFVMINKIICNCASHKRHVAQRRIAFRFVEDPRGYWRVNKRETRAVCISALYLRTLRRGRYSVSIHFSRRVPVCPHFAYNQRAASCTLRAPVSQSVGITVSRYPRPGTD